MTTIESTQTTGNLLTIQDIFSDKRYIIPDYQRSYSWESKQRMDLLGDIDSIVRADMNYQHYTGTIVAAKTDSTEGIYELVDGQQRIISIYILLHEIYLQHKNNLPTSAIWLNDLFKKVPRKLKLNSESDSFFSRCILDGSQTPINNKAHTNLIEAQEQFRTWLEEKWTKENIHTLFEAINKLGFLFYSPNKSDEIGLMFEIINNRGKVLSELEKIKNYLMYYSVKTKCEELASVVDVYWASILQNLSTADKTSNDDEDTFLRYCWIIFHSPNKSESYKVYDALKQDYPIESSTEEHQNSLIEFVKMLDQASLHYKEFYTSDDDVLERISYQPSHASIMPLFLSICLNTSTDGVGNKNKLLELIEKLNFRVYVCPNVTKRADSYQGELFSLANGYYLNVKKYNIEKSCRESINSTDLIQSLKDFIKINGSTESLIKSLAIDKTEENMDFNLWHGLIYFLANYEIDLEKKKTFKLSDIITKKHDDQKSDDVVTKEHIWARKNRVAEGNSRDCDYHEKNRLGNFVLLEGGINSQCSNNDLDEKLPLYKGDAVSSKMDNRRSAYAMVYELEDILKEAKKFVGAAKKTKNYYYDLYRYINDARETNLINFAIKRWGLEDEPALRVSVDSAAANDGKIYSVK